MPPFTYKKYQGGYTWQTLKNGRLNEEELQELVAASDSGARNVPGTLGKVIATVALLWSVFQVLLASPIGLKVLPGDMINNARQIHLAFAIFLSAMSYPLFKSASKTSIPWYDWGLGLGGAFLSMYGYVFYEKIVANGGACGCGVTPYFALAGLAFLFIAAYRTLGPVMVVSRHRVSGLCVLRLFRGRARFDPLGRGVAAQGDVAYVDHDRGRLWHCAERLDAIRVSLRTFWRFARLRQAPGNYFIKMAFGALGHLRGGPAKAAVVGSAATGLISGSSIANVVTTGTFTIPLMKRVGFSAEKAGSVEVASSVNGQIMPPVMGAAAFLMVEYVGISYFEVIKHAFVPAIISYIALVYIVHLEAVKNNMPTLGNKVVSLWRTIMGMFLFFAGFGALCYATQYPVRLITSVVPEGSGWILAVLIGVIYVGLVKLAADADELEIDDPNAEVMELPDVAKLWKAGALLSAPDNRFGLLSDDRTQISGAVGLLGNLPFVLHPAHAKAAQGDFPWRKRCRTEDQRGRGRSR